MSKIDYKLKYQELKLKFFNSVDVAFRLGYEAGMKDAQLESLQQAQQAQSNNQNQTNDSVDAKDASVSENPQGSELDQHIAELESMLGKSEVDVNDLKKSLDKLKELQQLKKSTEAIKGISKALHKPGFKLSQNANHNLDSASKKTVSTQQQIVDDIFKTWQEEESKAKKDISDILNVENIIGKD